MRTAAIVLSTILLAAVTTDALAQGGGGVSVEQRYYPSGERGSSAILLERTTPREVRLGEEFTYQITLTNLSRAEITDLILTETMPPTFRSRGVTPEPTRTAGEAFVWGIPRFPAGAVQTIRISGSTDRPTELTWCAAVTFNTSLCANTRIVEPRLALQKTAPAEVLLCDQIPMRLVVTNTGTGPARNVRVLDVLPPGLTAADGQNRLAFDAGDLAAGQSREFTFIARAASTGSFTNTAQATEQGGLSAEASSTTIVRKPELSLVKQCPGLRYLGRAAVIELLVRNVGDAPAKDVVLADPLPPGVELISADNDGRLSGGAITWQLGTIPPGAARSVSLTVRAVQPGAITNTATARAYCAEATATCQMEIRGIPAILLECVDSPDPVEVGTDTTYTIEVTNQGSATGTNIIVEVTLPPQEEFVTANGPTRGDVQGKIIRFAPLPTLAPKARAAWTVTVKGVQPADVRFKVSMKSDQTDTPVEETESTNIY